MPACPPLRSTPCWLRCRLISLTRTVNWPQAPGASKATAEAGLSLGDRFCLAQAVRDRLPAWTADRRWRTIASRVDVDIVVIR